MIPQNPANPIGLASQLKNKAYNPLSRDEEMALVYQARAGSRIAKERLFRSAAKALVQVARKSNSFARKSGFDLDELVSIGYLAFERAIIDYKPIFNTPFSGFFYKCAHFKILDAVRKYRTAISLPVPNNLSPNSKLAWERASSMISIDEKMERFESFDIPIPEREEREPEINRQKLRKIAKSVAGIAPRKKEVFRLYYGINAAGEVGDYIDSCSEIASRLGLACSSARSNLYSATEQVKNSCASGRQWIRNPSSRKSASNAMREWHQNHAEEHQLRMSQVHHLRKKGWICLSKGKWFKEGYGATCMNEALKHENAQGYWAVNNSRALDLESPGTQSRFPRRPQA